MATTLAEMERLRRQQGGATGAAKSTGAGAGSMPDRKLLTTPTNANASFAAQTQAMVPQVQSGGMTGGNSVGQSRRTDGARGLPVSAGGTPRSAPAPVRREAASTVGQSGQLPGVSGRLNTLLDSDSPYLARARTRGKQYANRRGLLNSSIAAGASEASAIDAALPIAQGDAQIAAGERGMRSQEYMQARDHRVQQLMQDRGLDHDAAQNQANRELEDMMQRRGIESEETMQGRDIDARQLMQQRDHRVQQLMQDRGLDHATAQNQADRELKESLQERDIGAQASRQQRDIEAQASRQESQQTFASEQASLDREAARIAQQRGISHEAAMHEAQRAATQKNALDVATRDVNSQYMKNLSVLASNTSIPSKERRRLEEHYAFLRDQQMEGLQSVYGTSLTWESARQPEEDE